MIMRPNRYSLTFLNKKIITCQKQVGVMVFSEYIRSGACEDFCDAFQLLADQLRAVRYYCRQHQELKNIYLCHLKPARSSNG